ETYLRRAELPGILHSSQVQGEQRSFVELEQHVDELALRELKAADRTIELHARLGIVECRFVARAGRAHRTPNDAEARLVQARQRTAQPLRLRQYCVAGKAAVLQHQLARDRRA